MDKKMKGAKALGKTYAASRLKRSRAQPSASRGADISGGLGFNSPRSILSALTQDGILSFASIASIGSAGSILSIGKAGAAPGRGSSEPEPDILLEEVLLEEVPLEADILLEEVPPETDILTEETPPPEGMPPEPRPEP